MFFNVATVAAVAALISQAAGAPVDSQAIEARTYAHKSKPIVVLTNVNGNSKGDSNEKNGNGNVAGNDNWNDVSVSKRAVVNLGDLVDFGDSPIVVIDPSVNANGNTVAGSHNSKNGNGNIQGDDNSNGVHARDLEERTNKPHKKPVIILTNENGNSWGSNNQKNGNGNVAGNSNDNSVSISKRTYGKKPKVVVIPSNINGNSIGSGNSKNGNGNIAGSDNWNTVDISKRAVLNLGELVDTGDDEPIIVVAPNVNANGNTVAGSHNSKNGNGNIQGDNNDDDTSL